MNFLLDANVVSEPTKRKPEPRVVRWFSAQPGETLFLSVLTLGELQRGIRLLDDGPRRRELLRWLEGELVPAFEGRILDVDRAVMGEWAELQNRCLRQGRRLSVMDGLIAATALAHGLTIATRNTGDFPDASVSVFNPWQA